MRHIVEPSVVNLQGCFSRERAPILTIESGDTIVCRTLDAGWDSTRSPKTAMSCAPRFRSNGAPTRSTTVGIAWSARSQCVVRSPA